VIRVLHVITRLTLGGSSENTIAQVAALQAAGYDCALAVGMDESEAPVLDDARRRGCQLIGIPGLGREIAPTRDLTALAVLARLMRRQRVAIVHTHTSKAGFIGRLAARLARVPAVIHQPHGHIFYGYYGKGGAAFFMRLERVAARWSDRIVTLTERGTAEHLEQGIGRREQFAAVPSGVPTTALQALAPGRAEARARLGIAADDFIVLGIGRFVHIKGFDVLVAALGRACAEVPALRVVLVGDGPERDALQAQAVALGVGSRLELRGAVAGASALVDYLAAADVCAAPSRNEGMGRVLVEAMALGLPVVGSAVGGIPSVIGADEAGRLVPADDPEELARALTDLERDRALRVKLGEAARQRAEVFSTRVAEVRLLALYAGLVREKRLR
jgi:glycosyltransferase involved in cell wall biosynthesis